MTATAPKLQRNIFRTTSAIALAFAMAVSSRVQAQSISTAPYWDGVTGFSGFAIGSASAHDAGGDSTTGQTFTITDPEDLVTSITLPIFGYGPKYTQAVSDFQIGLATWNGTEAGSSLLYLSSMQVASGGTWSSFTVNPNVVLPAGQYILLLTPYNYLSTDAGSEANPGFVPTFYYTYTGGELVEQSGTDFNISDLSTQSWTTDTGSIAFTINYSVVPEPGTFALLCFGGISIFGFVSKKRISCQP